MTDLSDNGTIGERRHGEAMNIGDVVELNSGGPPMAIIEITTPGRNGAGTDDIVVWWRNLECKPQILEIDARCVRKLRAPVPAVSA